MKKLLTFLLAAGFLWTAFAETRYCWTFNADNPPEKYGSSANSKLIRKKDSVQIFHDWGQIQYWDWKLDPGRNYFFRIEGRGLAELHYNDFLNKTIDIDGEITFTLKVPADAPDHGTFRINRVKKSQRDFEISRLVVVPFPDPPGFSRLNRERQKALRAGIPRLRGISLAVPLTRECVSALTDGKGNFIRLRFSALSQLPDVKKALELLTAFPGISVTVEFAPATWPGTEKIAELWEKAAAGLRPWRKRIFAYAPVIGNAVPNWRNDAVSIWPRLRKLFPGERLIFQPGPTELQAEFNPLPDENLIYAASISDNRKFSGVRDFENIHCVPILAEPLLPFLNEADDCLWNWSIAAGTSAAAPRIIRAAYRPLHKNGDRQYQLDSIVNTLLADRSPGALHLAYATDSHYLSHPEKWRYGADSLDHMRDMAWIARQAKLDLIVHGGDIISGKNRPKPPSLQDLRDIVNVIRSSGVAMAVSIGNHDNNVQYSGKAADTISDGEWFDIVTKPALDSGATGDPQHPQANYFYYDFPRQKIRVIVLATLENPMRERADGKVNFHICKWDLSCHQLQWLADKALNFSGKSEREKWSVLFFSHLPPDESFPNFSLWQGVIQAFQTGTKFQGETMPGQEPALYPGRITCDFSRQGKGRILALIHGHFHQDRHNYRNGYLNAGFWCDLRSPTSKHPPESRPVGTPEAASIAVLSIDPARDELRVLRYGLGRDMVLPLRKKTQPASGLPEK